MYSSYFMYFIYSGNENNLSLDQSIATYFKIKLATQKVMQLVVTNIV
jgi:hypothetical protein